MKASSPLRPTPPPSTLLDLPFTTCDVSLGPYDPGADGIVPSVKCVPLRPESRSSVGPLPRTGPDLWDQGKVRGRRQHPRMSRVDTEYKEKTHLFCH